LGTILGTILRTILGTIWGTILGWLVGCLPIRISSLEEFKGEEVPEEWEKGMRNNRRQMVDEGRNVRDEDGSLTGVQPQVNHFEVG
jgi:hypothetical protein